ncbi:hypothetical protein HC766_02900 [Candidatus Gracilibacteria bacterium]|nr:hypothetical protein [Candidatus Gracilibacteria bacterium]
MAKINVKGKEKIITKAQIHKTDTASPEAQIALLTESINQLTGHLQVNPKDFSSCFKSTIATVPFAMIEAKSLSFCGSIATTKGFSIKSIDFTTLFVFVSINSTTPAEPSPVNALSGV